MDNLALRLLPNSYHRLCLNYAQIAGYIYANHSQNIDHKIRLVVRDHHKATSKVSINAFRNLLRFETVVPHLIRLLSAGGIWTVTSEDAFSALVKCRVEGVGQF